MIGRLRGTVIAEEADGIVVIDVGGVGYEVSTPLGTIGRASARAADGSGSTVTLFIHTHVREDALILFGFASDLDREAFRTLIGVSSVGPKTAIGILSALPGPELARAIAAKDLGKLTTISGIGKKTAERLLLELRDKLPVSPDATAGASATPATTTTKSGRAPRSPNGELLARALVNLGYKNTEADRAVTTLETRLDTAPMAELIKESLALLAR
jgi:Holliday junction DNA helicase RuvA